ncbi:MAG: hypothetical protein HPY61_01640 [Methanotrichaceae archaeon]|nr:hypothetical protein [Methanotrichaceae archaeon]
MMCAKKSSDGQAKRLECSDEGRLYVVLYGRTSTGDLVPVLVDETGRIVISS